VLAPLFPGVSRRTLWNQLYATEMAGVFKDMGLQFDGEGAHGGYPLPPTVIYELGKHARWRAGHAVPIWLAETVHRCLEMQSAGVRQPDMLTYVRSRSTRALAEAVRFLDEEAAP
jgi:hypothetical protein